MFSIKRRHRPLCNACNLSFDRRHCMKKALKSIALAALLCTGLMSATAFAQITRKPAQGTEIRFLMNKHPFTTYIEPKIAEFEKLTGVKVVMESFPEDQYRNKLT